MDNDARESFEGVLQDLIEIIPKVLLFLVILLIGWLIAKLVEKAVDAILERVGFDRLVERTGVGRMTAPAGFDPSSLAAKLVYLAILLITLQLAFNVFGPNPISDLLAGIVAWLPMAFVAIVIIVIAIYLAGIVRDIIRGSLGGTSYGRFLSTAAYVFIIGLGVIAALGQMGIAILVTGPILIAVLATIGGILVVGLGGGMIVPMQRRWERILTGAEDEFAQQSRTRGATPSGPTSSGPTTPGPTVVTPREGTIPPAGP